jgi:hypothetical protein
VAAADREGKTDISRHRLWLLAKPMGGKTKETHLSGNCGESQGNQLLKITYGQYNTSRERINSEQQPITRDPRGRDQDCEGCGLIELYDPYDPDEAVLIRLVAVWKPKETETE